MVDDAELLELVEMEIRGCWTSTNFRATTRRLVGSALKALEGTVGDRRAVDHQAGGGDGRVSAGAGARYGQAVPDADRGCVLDIGRGTVVTGRVERGVIKVGRGGDRGHQADPEDDLHGRGDVPQAAGPGAGGDNVGVLLREPSVTK